MISTTLVPFLGNLGLYVMEFDKFYHFASLSIEDDFVLTYRGYLTEDVLQAIDDTVRQQL